MKQVEPVDLLTADELMDRIEGKVNAVMEITIEAEAIQTKLERLIAEAQQGQESILADVDRVAEILMGHGILYQPNFKLH